MSERTTMKRLPERGDHSRETIHSILDEALICHIGFVHDGYPVVIPTIHARHGDTLYVHGSPASRMLRDLKDGVQVCVTATIVDGIVAARSLFHHSMNYRSVVVFAEARLVTEPEERLAAFRAVTEHILPGRWDEARHPDRNEDKGTLLLALPIDEASAKIRSGPPEDEEEDYALDIWAGIIPLELVAGEPVPDPVLTPGIEAPEYIRDYEGGR